MPVDSNSLDNLRIDRSQGDEGNGGSGRRWLAWTLAALVAILALTFFLLRPRPIAVQVATVQEVAAGSGPAAVLNGSGYLTARRQATVSSKVSGKVIEVDIEEGMKVEAGQVLARLEDTQTQVQLALTHAQLGAAEKDLHETDVRLAQAQLDLRRTKELVARAIKSQADLDASQAEVDSLAARLEAQRQQVEVARRQVAVVRQALDDLVIRAPFAGVAISKNAQPGEIISPMSAGGGFTRTGISTIVDMGSLEIEVDVNEAYIQRVTPGQKVVATLDAYPDWQIPAHVITTIPAADREKATVKVRIGFDRLDPRLLPDMGAKVAFLGDETAAPVAARKSTRVPRAALRGGASQEYVLVVTGDQVERRAVRLGPAPGDPAEVLAGLTAGEQVVVVGPPELAAGTRVKIVPAP